MNITKDVRLIYQIPTFSYHPVNYYICPYSCLLYTSILTYSSYIYKVNAFHTSRSDMPSSVEEDQRDVYKRQVLTPFEARQQNNLLNPLLSLLT